MRRILSIDGGGIKGVFPASFLATLEEQANGDIAKYFDLIVGTSTGGIVALAFGLGLSAKETPRFYELGMAQHLVGDRDQIVRISPHVGSRYEMDDPSRIAVLRGLGATEARIPLPQVRDLFLQSEAEPFVPNASSSQP